MRPTRLRGARTHNLKGIDLDLEPGELTAVVGVSGAGKSSLAFGTLYAEGQRRYVESFSAYARQFLERLPRPPVDELDPVPAGIAVDRQGAVRTSRSTVGTMTEVADYAKSLWARIATLHCPTSGRQIRRDSPQSAADEVLAAFDGERIVVTYPVPVQDAERFLGVREALLSDGYRRLLVDGEVRDLSDVRPSEIASGDVSVQREEGRHHLCMAPERPPEAHVVADRLVARAGERSRLVEALEMAMERGLGRVDVLRVEDGRETDRKRFSRGLHCTECDKTFRDATPGMFSFNSPLGACEGCRGFGRVITVDLDKVIPDPRKTLGRGAIAAWTGKATQWERRMLRTHAATMGVPLDVPFEDLEPWQQHWLIEGGERSWPKGWGGLRRWFDWLERKAYKMHVRVFLSRFRKYVECPDCDGDRLRPQSLLWKVHGSSIAELFRMPVRQSLAVVEGLLLEHADDPATTLLLQECRGRLFALSDVGLGYLTLDRQSRTLSGGEVQRVSLTSALGSSLTGAMFVLDEPSVGLHPTDVGRLAEVARRLTSGGNQVLLVEHDSDMIRAADRVLELGPGAGSHGGELVFDGTPRALAGADTPTGRALSAEPPLGRKRRKGKRTLKLRGARGHNLRGVDLSVPLGAMTCVTGVSGSGKSTLVLETLVPAVRHALRGGREDALAHGGIEGTRGISDVNHVDQAPLGRTSRGNPATYLKIWDVIRNRFAAEPLSKERGHGPGYFSANVQGGRCEVCKGQGFETVEMQFLADVTFSCPACQGRRFVEEALEVRHLGLDVSQVLELTVEQAGERFAHDRQLTKRLTPLFDVGLGYLTLGQPLNTMSGGEAQRLKLALALSQTARGALVVLDEPTAGLHPEDVTPLLEALDRLVDRGDTVVVVEHDMRVAAHADYVVDLGPGAGDEGGTIVARGTPERVAASKKSATAAFLARALGKATDLPAPDLGQAARSSPSIGPDAQETGEVVLVSGAREHNLRDVHVAIPREQLVVVSGPSGSGKSSLAFDIVYAEGQRRFLETLSPYARQYMPQLPRPDVDRVSGVPPTVALEQRMTRGGGTSTVATVTEVAHFLRILYARIGRAAEEAASVASGAQPPEAVTTEVRRRFGPRARVAVYAPVVQGRKGYHRDLLDKARRDGFAEARIDGEVRTLKPGMALERYKEHDIDLPFGRVRPRDRDELTAAVRAAAARADGEVRILSRKGEMLVHVGEGAALEHAHRALDPRLFSFNTKQGACPTCEGRGVVIRKVGRGRKAKEEERCCSVCDGTRLSELARSVRVEGQPITHFLGMSVSRAREVFAQVRFEGRDARIGDPVLAELDRRLAFLDEVGVGYLGLSRSASTLSGGETQRVRLAAQLGSGLTGVLYVLDEPTIGLHPRDTHRLIHALRSLVDRGNSVLVVEHDADTIEAADHVIDVGPGGGVRGGRIVAQGSPEQIKQDPASITGPALRRGPRIPERRAVRGADWLEIEGARENNLQELSARFPLGRLTAVTGVSGSGKSTLVREVLLPAVRDALGLVTERVGSFHAVRGAELLERAVEVDQSPIGRTPRSVPATYVGVWAEIRKLYAGTPEARARGFSASRFSFNVAEGRCPECNGNGALTVEMAFLPDVLIACESCRGMRFSNETLDIKLHHLSAGELLELDIEEAARVLSPVPKVARPLQLLTELGLGYLKLGQPSNTLSGGEAQRLKLVAELGTGAKGRTLYVLDEPTTGLHRDDVGRLITLLERFVDRGDTVVVIEHNPDVILSADWIVDLGPEGGEGGGHLVVEGAPEKVARSKRSHTGEVIRREMERVMGKAP